MIKCAVCLTKKRPDLFEPITDDIEQTVCINCSKSIKKSDVSALQLRPCLVCDKQFLTTKIIRVCPRCKNEPDRDVIFYTNYY